MGESLSFSSMSPGQAAMALPMEVDSPPGRMRASTFSRSAVARISTPLIMIGQELKILFDFLRNCSPICNTHSMFYKRHPIRDIVLILERLRDRR